jgi:hypothetical protein
MSQLGSLTVARRSVLISSFLKPRVCQALVRSTTQRAPAWSGSPLVLIYQSWPKVVNMARVLFES